MDEVPGTSLASVKPMFVSPATVAVALFDLLPKPTTGLPAASVTVNLTTGALAIVTLVTVTCGARSFHAAALASVAGVVLLGTLTVPLRFCPSVPVVPSAPGGPAGPVEPAGPVSPSPQPASATASMLAAARVVQ